MDQLTIAAASGMRSRIEALDLLANNIANVNTAGYKSDREFYNLYASAEAESLTTLPDIEGNWIDFGQGMIKETGNPLNLALSGRGFLAADSPAGTLYTRNGALRLSTAGILQTADGYPVRTTDPPFRIQARPDGGPLQIQKDGSVLQDGQALGVLALADWREPAALEKQGGSYFRLAAANFKPTAPSGLEVLQGRLEASNSGPAEAAVQLVNVLRQFEMLQKAVILGGEMNKKAVEDVARVTA
jgi:flagellar basal-body rod protein FlgF